MSPLAETIVCVECGGTAHLLTGFPPDDPPMAGDIVPYRCADCMDRFDLVVDEADLEDENPDFI
jgi:DNA-directed RNA polymerase subunit RPC12/RpoP